MWWLSFADANLPEGTQFLGAAVVRATNMEEAVRRAHKVGINPGGEVQGLEVSPDLVPKINDKWIERLLTHKECEQFDEEMMHSLPENTGHVQP